MFVVGDRVAYKCIPGISDEAGEATILQPHQRIFDYRTIVAARVSAGHVFEFYADELQIITEVGTFPFLNPGKGRV